MSNYKVGSRVHKYHKRRKNNKFLFILLIIGAILFITLIFTLIFNNENKSDKNNEPINENASEPQNENNSINTSDSTTENDHNGSLSIIEEDDESEQDEMDEQIYSAEPMDPSDDNVLEAFKGNWEPAGTSQSEPHTVNYSDGSVDREEMEKAIQLATGIDDMTIWWIGNGGDQKVIATVSPKDEPTTYRVYLSWISGEGWQPTLVEQLKENDKK